MNARERGAMRGHEYLRRSKIEDLTFDEYCALGRVDAHQRYTKKRSREEYVSGWRFTGERFLSLFKIDDKNVLPVQRRLAGVRGSLGRAVIDLEPLLGWRSSNAVVQGYLQNVYQAIDEAQNYLDVLLDMVKQEVDRQ